MAERLHGASREPNSRRRRATGRTRPTGSKAPGRGLKVASGDDRRGETAVPIELLKEVGAALATRARRLQPQPQDRAPARGQAPGDRERRGHRLGDRRGARFRHALRRRHAGAPLRPGFRPRHLLAAPCGAGRSGDRGALRPAQPCARRPGAVRGASTARCPKRRCWASNTATPWPSRMRWCCGRRSSAISPTARRSSSTSSSPRAKPNGCACRAS